MSATTGDVLLLSNRIRNADIAAAAAASEGKPAAGGKASTGKSAAGKAAAAAGKTAAAATPEGSKPAKAAAGKASGAIRAAHEPSSSSSSSSSKKERYMSLGRGQSLYSGEVPLNTALSGTKSRGGAYQLVDLVHNAETFDMRNKEDAFEGAGSAEQLFKDRDNQWWGHVRGGGGTAGRAGAPVGEGGPRPSPWPRPIP